MAILPHLVEFGFFTCCWAKRSARRRLARQLSTVYSILSAQNTATNRIRRSSDPEPRTPNPEPPRMSRRIIILTEGHTEPHAGKTAASIIRYRGHEVLA